MANPTLSTLRTRVSRDLRDPTNATFTTAMVDDLVNSAIMELNRLAPRESKELIGSGFMQANPTVLEYVFRVEMQRDSDAVVVANIPPADEGSQSGWEHWSGSVYVPKALSDTYGGDHSLVLWGYVGRAVLTTGASVSDLTDEEEFAVRLHCRLSAYSMLLAERGLFKQWQGASQNSDISTPQLQSMVSLYSREWDNMRRRLYIIRRV